MIRRGRAVATPASAAAILGLVATLLACGGERDAQSAPHLTAQLSALGYVDWARIEVGESPSGGVVHSELDAAELGFNLMSSRALAGAQLIDMRGRIVHEWQPRTAHSAGWNHVELAANGDLLVITQKPSLARIDRESKLLWERDLHVHHDLALAESGEIVALERVPATRDTPAGRVRFLGENLLRLAPDGSVIARLPLQDLLGEHLTPGRLTSAAADTPDPRSAYRRALDLWRAPPADIFHANSVEILPRDVPGLGPAGAVLVSLRNLDLVVVIDLAAPAITWSFGPGNVERQHQASLLENDHVLIFDNGRERRHSRVVEVDPTRHAIVWEYSGTPAGSLRSRSQGGAEFLPGGNVLIVESERGRAIEVTREGEIVWEYLHPELDAARGARASIYRMTRVALPW